MFEELISSINRQWSVIWSAFSDAGPLANALQILGFVGATVGSVRWYVHRRLRDKDGQIADLKEDIVRRDRALDGLRVSQREKELELTALERRFPDVALAQSAAELAQGNDDRAARVIASWLSDEGEPISQLLLQRARWAIGHSSGEARDVGLAVSEGFATAALIFQPSSREAELLISHIEGARAAEVQWRPALAEALAKFDAHSEDAFNSDDAIEAAKSLMEAERELSSGHALLAHSHVTRAVRLNLRSLGPNALPTLRSQLFESIVLEALGRQAEALSLIEKVVETEQEVLGPEDPDTLRSRLERGRILLRLGDNNRGLSEVRHVVQCLTADGRFGPSHSATLSARETLVLAFTASGRASDAQAEARLIVDSCLENPVLGPNHLRTISAQHALAYVLFATNRGDEALALTRKVAEKVEQLEDGKPHESLLALRVLEAQILISLKQPEQALTVARRAAERFEQVESWGPSHPDVLQAHHFAVQSMANLERWHEALPLAQRLADSETAHPSLGPIHPHTLRGLQLLASIKARTGTRAQAVSMMRDVVASSERHPSLGPKHPNTIEARAVLAAIEGSDIS